MKKSILAMLAMFLAATPISADDDAVPPKTHPDSSGWQKLFADDLSDAIYPKGIWFHEDGLLTASEDKIIWTKKQYKKCIIDLEFKNGPNANSGVFVYGSDMEKWIVRTLEVQILDDFGDKWQKVPPTWKCGGIFGRLAPSKRTVKPDGQWNRMTITCLGPMIYVLLNGEQITKFDMRKWTSPTKNPDGTAIPPWLCDGRPTAEIPTYGHIGLQGKHGGAPIYFRNLKIKPLDQ
jgi:hypothetical protein